MNPHPTLTHIINLNRSISILYSSLQRAVSYSESRPDALIQFSRNSVLFTIARTFSRTPIALAIRDVSAAASLANRIWNARYNREMTIVITPTASEIAEIAIPVHGRLLYFLMVH